MNQGRIVAITGAAGGMGALFVERFLANRDTVIATDTSEEALAKLAKARRGRPTSHHSGGHFRRGELREAGSLHPRQGRPRRRADQLRGLLPDPVVRRDGAGRLEQGHRY
jgi:NAD(P)-dependent dehydrogenase (short-subunit alcohol dehydrogenase family)